MQDELPENSIDAIPTEATVENYVALMGKLKLIGTKAIRDIEIIDTAGRIVFEAAGETATRSILKMMADDDTGSLVRKEMEIIRSDMLKSAEAGVRTNLRNHNEQEDAIVRMTEKMAELELQVDYLFSAIKAVADRLTLTDVPSVCPEEYDACARCLFTEKYTDYPEAYVSGAIAYALDKPDHIYGIIHDVAPCFERLKKLYFEKTGEDVKTVLASVKLFFLTFKDHIDFGDEHAHMHRQKMDKKKEARLSAEALSKNADQVPRLHGEMNENQVRYIVDATLLRPFLPQSIGIGAAGKVLRTKHKGLISTRSAMKEASRVRGKMALLERFDLEKDKASFIGWPESGRPHFYGQMREHFAEVSLVAEDLAP